MNPMREILFRGKMDNGEWMYGSFCMDALEQFNGLCGVDGFIRLYDKAKGKMQTYEVDRETVGQYTGKTDKNKKRVFDGDIIRMFDAKPPFDVGVVQWDDHDQCYVVRSTWSEKCHLTDFGNLGRPEYFEVIGNIHDNPELLKGGEG